MARLYLKFRFVNVEGAMGNAPPPGSLERVSSAFVLPDLREGAWSLAAPPSDAWRLFTAPAEPLDKRLIARSGRRKPLGASGSGHSRSKLQENRGAVFEQKKSLKVCFKTTWTNRFDFPCHNYHNRELTFKLNIKIIHLIVADVASCLPKQYILLTILTDSFGLSLDS